MTIDDIFRFRKKSFCYLLAHTYGKTENTISQQDESDPKSKIGNRQSKMTLRVFPRLVKAGFFRKAKEQVHVLKC